MRNERYRQAMASVRDDLEELFDFAWTRLRRRLDGLTDDELAWSPTADPALTLVWRLAHIVELLDAPRNAEWLDRIPSDSPLPTAAATADGALSALDAAFARWRGHLVATTDESLARPIGRVAGPYAGSSRRAFVLHVADELIHHAAEAALLRDLYGST